MERVGAEAYTLRMDFKLRTGYGLLQNQIRACSCVVSLWESLED